MDIFAPIQSLADLATYQWISLTPDTYLANTVNFFIYDVIKIGLLLMVINYVMAITRYYFPVQKAQNLLTNHNWYGLDYLLAALLGVVTPFCSCSSIPLFIGFLSAGIPLGVTFAFLISSPLVNEASLYLFPAVFGWQTTLLYNLIGILISVLGGLLIQKLNLKRFIQPEFLALIKKKNKQDEKVNKAGQLKKLLGQWTQESVAISKKVFPYVLLGVGLGAVIHGFVPQSFIEKNLTGQSLIAVPLAVIMGIPLYANSVSLVPVMEALVGKGISVGTALAFMTATVTLSLPEALMLKKVLRWQLLTAFFAVTITGILAIGFLLNFLA